VRLPAKSIGWTSGLLGSAVGGAVIEVLLNPGIASAALPPVRPRALEDFADIDGDGMMDFLDPDPNKISPLTNDQIDSAFDQYHKLMVMQLGSYFDIMGDAGSDVREQFATAKLIYSLRQLESQAMKESRCGCNQTK